MSRIGAFVIFWFNRDSRLAIASVSIPYGQRFIEVDIERQDQVLFVAPGNLLLKFTVETQAAAAPGPPSGTAAALNVEEVAKWITYTPTLASGSVIDTQQRILNMELYINNIFVNPEVHDIYIRRIGFSLIRVHRFQSNRLTASSENVLLSNLKWPIETLYIGLRPAVNISAANPNQYRDWHRLTLLTDQLVACPARAEAEAIVDPLIAFNVANPAHKFSTSDVIGCNYSYPVVTKTIDTLQLQAHGIDIYKPFKAEFFNSYQPYVFGGTNIITPEDEGAMMMNMCLYPGTYQPSGHINVSRAREFYLQYVSSYVAPATPADLLVLGKAINFLLISDGKLHCRSTCKNMC